MTLYLILCRSLTHAQRTARLLERAGFTPSIRRTPRELSVNGCGYAVSLVKNFPQAVELLNRNRMIQGKLYRQAADGSYEELRP